MKLKYLLPLALFAPLLMAPSGGYPSFPTFGSVTVNGPGNPPTSNPPTQFFINGNTPELFWVNGSAAVDNRIWDNYEDSAGAMHFRALTDAQSSALNWMDVTRTGISAVTISLAPAAQTSLLVHGSPLFGPQVVNLNAASTRTSTTALTADAVLTLTLPAAGNYKIDFSGLITGMTTGLGGIDISFAIGAPGFATSSYVCTISGGSATAIPNAGGTFSSAPTSGNSCFLAAGAPYTGSAPLIMSGIVNASASTTVSVTWSQAVSNATGTSINAGAYLLATRLQ